MPAPAMLLDLALTLHPDQPASRQDWSATLASRLGYAEVWLPVGADLGFPDPARLDALAAAAGGARLGLVVGGPEDAAIAGLLRLSWGVGAEALLELAGSTVALVRAVGGADAWRSRVRLPEFDPGTAGTVIGAATRPDTVTGVAVAAARRAASRLSPAEHPVVAALPVSIGRTHNEAEARALRDPRFGGHAGADAGGAGLPREAGLFGTYEQAQTQVLELAAAGADALRVTVPDEVDVADLLAQVRSLVVGATPVLHARRS
jgi:hypothetical protein